MAKYLHQITSTKYDTKVKMLSIKAILASIPDDEKDDAIMQNVLEHMNDIPCDEPPDDPTSGENIRVIVTESDGHDDCYDCSISHEHLFHSLTFDDDNDFSSNYIRTLQFVHGDPQEHSIMDINDVPHSMTMINSVQSLFLKIILFDMI